MLKKFSWVFAETISTVTFQFLSIVILARMLTPRDYGLLGMMIIFIALGNMIVDSGMGSAIVKKESVNQKDYSTLFIYNLAMSAVIYVTIFCFARPIANFYNEPELEILIKILSLIIVIAALGDAQNAKLNREHRFKELAIVAFASNFVSLAFAIVLAEMGYGVWALICQQLCLIALRVILLFMRAQLIPSFSFSFNSFKYQFNFGINILLSNILNAVFLNISASIIPKIAGVIKNGYYIQANRLQNVPVAILTMITDKAMFPILARHNDAVLFKENARIMIRYTALVAFPVIFFCSALSKPIILLLLGRKWLGAAAYLEILFFAGLGFCIQYYGKNLFKSAGATTKMLHLELTKTIIGLAILLISFNFGMMFLIYGIVLASTISAFITMIYLKKYLNYSLMQHVHDLRGAFLLSLAAYAIIKALNIYYFSDTAWGIFYFILGFVIYAFLGRVIKYEEIMEMLLLLKKFIQRYSQQNAMK